MQVVTKIDKLQNIIKTWRQAGLTVGLVPTMGFLHAGHASLIKRASIENDRVIVSDFVNPTQFAPNEDLASYPRDLERDCNVANKAGAHLIFHPSANSMYPSGFSSSVNITGVSENLCGKSRPIHFQGVCTVICKLFNLVMPDNAYFGEKDAQQLAVIRQLVADLNFKVQIIGCPIIREEDGLAKSSRNKYLTLEQRDAAPILNKALTAAKSALKNSETDSQIIKNLIEQTLLQEPLAKIDYIEIVDSVKLQPISTICQSALIAIAVFIGDIRLIDNFTFKVATK